MPWNPGGFVNFGSYLLWSTVATLVLAGGMYGAQAWGVSRMSIPFLLGSAWSTDHKKATVLGFGAHLVNGLAFAFIYVMGFEALDRATWWIGTVGGLTHGLVVLTAGMALLPALHPNMADERTGPTPTRWLQPPGFLARNYGNRTPAVALVLHMVYGAILGTFYTVA